MNKSIEQLTIKCVSCTKYPLKNYKYYKLNSRDVEAVTFSLIDQQEIVDFKRNHAELNLREYGHITIEPNVITYNERIYIAIDSLNPTFEQVIKEWEEAGYFYVEDDDCIYFDDDSRFIRIYKKTKEYCICDMFGTGICFNMKEHDLIHKIINTMKESKNE